MDKDMANLSDLVVITNYGTDGYSDYKFREFPNGATAVVEASYAEKLISDFPNWFSLVDVALTEELIAEHEGTYRWVTEEVKEWRKAKEEGRLEGAEEQYYLHPVFGSLVKVAPKAEEAEAVVEVEKVEAAESEESKAEEASETEGETNDEQGEGEGDEQPAPRRRGRPSKA